MKTKVELHLVLAIMESNPPCFHKRNNNMNFLLTCVEEESRKGSIIS